jgi:hypothetical protein
MNKNSDQKREKTGLALLNNDVVTALSESLQKRDDDGNFKQLPKWKVDELRKFKNDKLGSLSSKIKYIESNKLGDFKKLYFNERKIIETDFESKVNSFNETTNNDYNKLNKIISETFEKLINENKELLKNSDLNFKNFNSYLPSYSNKMSLTEKLTNEYLGKLEFNDYEFSSFKVETKFYEIVKFVFDINYFQQFRNIKEMVKKYESDFDKALLFNNLSVAYALFEELGTADTKLKELEKLTFEKVEINFKRYIFDDLEYNDLKSQRDKILHAL